MYLFIFSLLEWLKVVSLAGLLSRSGSITGLKPKVKQLTENIPQKPKEPASGDRKEGIARTLSKSLSLKSVSPAILNSPELTSKSQTATLQTQSKERVLDRKNSFVQNRNLSSKTLNSVQEQSAALSIEPLEDASDKGECPFLSHHMFLMKPSC